MRYLADILTLSRLIIAIVIFILALTGGAPEVVFILFIIAELTDAFDGTCARKWPFPKNKTPKYRKYAAIFDMVADVALAGFQVIFVILQINQPLGLAIIIYELVSSIGGDLLVYGKILGHPDNCTKNSLASRNFCHQLARSSQIWSVCLWLFYFRFCLVLFTSTPSKYFSRRC